MACLAQLLYLTITGLTGNYLISAFHMNASCIDFTTARWWFASSNRAKKHVLSMNFGLFQLPKKVDFFSNFFTSWNHLFSEQNRNERRKRTQHMTRKQNSRTFSYLRVHMERRIVLAGTALAIGIGTSPLWLYPHNSGEMKS